MSQKIKLPREVAEAITKATRDYASYSTIVKAKARGEVFPETYDGINAIDLDTLIRALYIGYEVEQTPEDEVKELYDYFGQYGVLYAGVDVQNKIGIILSKLGHKIEGVNT